MDEVYAVRQFEKHTLVSFRTPSLINPTDVERVRGDLLRMVDEEKRTHLVLDFHKVQFFSSQVIGILLTLNRKLSALPAGSAGLILCGVTPKLMELLKLSRLDKLLTIKPGRKEALES
jgi:anti-anti-sigma factor